MCIFIDDEEDNKGTTNMDGDDITSSSNTGTPKLQLKNQRTWLVPRRIVMIVVMVAILMLFLGMVMLAIGGGIGSAGLSAFGGVVFGLGIIGLVVCLLLCLYAFFYYGRKDVAVQTSDLWIEDTIDAPGYASIGRPSALKSNDSTLKRNGTAGQKKVTMAPGVGPYGESPPNGGIQGVQEGGIVYSGGNIVYQEPGVTAGAGGDAGTGAGGVKNTDPRGVGGRTLGGSEVGTGGIRITPLEGGAQPFPSPGGTTLVYGGQGGSVAGGQSYSMSRDGQVIYGGQGGHMLYSGGGSSASSSVIDGGNYTYPRNVVDGSSSQYSTLRNIPVTHIMSEQQRQQQQQQQQFQRQQQETVEYARVNKPVVKGGSLPAGSSLSSTSSHHYIVHGQGGNQKLAVEEDFDYDNPVERTPMIQQPTMPGTLGRQRQSSNSSNTSYHEQQMQFQRQRQQQRLQQLQQQQFQHQQPQFGHQQFTTHHTEEQLLAPRQLGTQSLQRQFASNPYSTPLQQQKQQQHQQQHYTYSASSSSSRKGQEIDDLPEPQPLVYPSARRPMTFEQVSSSKMSVYDNMMAGMKESEEE